MSSRMGTLFRANAYMKGRLSSLSIHERADLSALVKSFHRRSTLVCLVLALSGCTLTPLAVPAAVSGGAAGVNYSLTNVAYKTISHPQADVETALHKALKKMGIQETDRKEEEGKVTVTAVADSLTIYIDLEKITKSATSIRVNAEKELFLKDKATAAEIIVQTEKNLEVKE